MPRKPGIYRNIKRCEVEALGVNLKTGKTFTDTYSIPLFKDKVSCLKYLEKTYNNKTIKIVKVKNMVEKEISYFLSIDNYLKYAVEIEK